MTQEHRTDRIDGGRTQPRAGMRVLAGALCLTGSLALASSTPAHALDPQSAAALGAGGTTRATITELGTILDAPAMLPLAPRYEIGGGARLGPELEQLYQVQAVDSRTGPVTLGLTWLRNFGTSLATSDDLPGWIVADEELDARVNYDVFGGALGLSWLERRLAAALSVKYTLRNTAYVEQDGTIDIGASLAGRLSDDLYLSLSGDNLIFHSFVDTPMTVAGAVGWQRTELARAELDLVGDFGRVGDAPVLSGGLGGEVFAGGMVPIRLGLQRDGRDQLWFFTTGIGVQDKGFCLDYGMRHRLGDAGQGDTAFSRFSDRTWHGLSARISL